jgi:hypothetical protein
MRLLRKSARPQASLKTWTLKIRHWWRPRLACSRSQCLPWIVAPRRGPPVEHVAVVADLVVAGPAVATKPALTALCAAAWSGSL